MAHTLGHLEGQQTQKFGILETMFVNFDKRRGAVGLGQRRKERLWT